MNTIIMNSTLLSISRTFISFFFHYCWMMLLPLVLWAQDWTPDLTTTEGALKMVVSIDGHHHGQLSQSNMQFRRNFLDVAKKMGEVHGKLGPLSQEMIFSSVKVAGFNYPVEKGEFSAEYLTQVKDRLVKDSEILSSLSEFPMESYTHPSEDLARFKALLRQKFPQAPQKAEIEVKKIWNSYLRLLPFLYRSSSDSKVGVGEIAAIDDLSLKGLTEKIKQIGPKDLKQLYLEQYENLFSNVIEKSSKLKGLGTVKVQFQSLITNFINKDIQNATHLWTKEKQIVSMRGLSIEEVPVPVTSYRGCLGMDCSILSIPYYGLIKGTKVYWIRKDQEGKGPIHGYAFVADVTTSDGKVLPYILTLNGSTLTQDDARKLVKALALEKGVSEVIVPDFKKNEYLVNTDEIRKGMTFSSGVREMVTLPEGWSIVESYQDQFGPKDYQNYYKGEKVRQGVRVKLEDGSGESGESGESVLGNLFPTESQILPNPYSPIVDLQGHSLLDRAIMAATSLQENKDELELNEVLKILNLTREIKEAADTLLGFDTPVMRGGYRMPTPLSFDQYEKIHHSLGLSLPQMLKIVGEDRELPSIHKIYKAKPDLIDPHEWRTLAEKYYRKSVAALGPTASGFEAYSALKNLLSLPRVFDIWKDMPHYLKAIADENGFTGRNALYEEILLRPDVTPAAVDTIAKLISQPLSLGRYKLESDQELKSALEMMLKNAQKTFSSSWERRSFTLYLVAAAIHHHPEISFLGRKLLKIGQYQENELEKFLPLLQKSFESSVIKWDDSVGPMMGPQQNCHVHQD